VAQPGAAAAAKARLESGHEQRHGAGETLPQGAADAADAADAVDAADGADGADGAHGQGAVDVDWKGKCEWITTGRPGHE